MRMNLNTGLLAAGVPLLLLAGAAVSQTATQQDSPTVAWLDTEQVMRQTPGYTRAESTFTREMEGFQTEIQRMQTELDSVIAEFERSSVALSPTARQQREREIRELQQTYATRMQQLQVQAARRERELVGPLEERVQSVIEGVRAERNIGMIFDVSAEGSGIVAADRSLNLTPVVIQRLRSGAGAGGGAANDGGGNQP